MKKLSGKTRTQTNARFSFDLLSEIISALLPSHSKGRDISPIVPSMFKQGSGLSNARFLGSPGTFRMWIIVPE
jgi:hypothetical protein